MECRQGARPGDGGGGGGRGHTRSVAFHALCKDAGLLVFKGVTFLAVFKDVT